ncbi:junctional adhesion molecule A-like isoform X3 [Denticeps clupeoides]|uniref:junctional adhesion molecule A-like isoform X3 n=1 Tax=Denticeps clupeoides TaxID=299321 RepID=UPI0010A2E03B|nr:junctional adhesion molecule A-like isoform X3 [Denticeps clupeoides]
MNVALIFSVFMLITGASCGLMFTCDARQNTTCYAALGHPVYLQLINVEQPQLSFTAGTQKIFNIKKNIITRQNLPPNWQFIISNWTVIINPAERKDTGTYSTEIYDEGGSLVGTNWLHLFIEAPVSSVTLNITCLPSERRVTCSSSGDSPQYSWTLDGTPLGEGGTDVILKEEATGALTCTVTNNVSSVNKTQDLNPCRRTTTPLSTSPPQTVLWPTAVVLGVILLCLSVTIGVFYISKRKKVKETTGNTSGDPNDVIYTQVNINNQRKKINIPDVELEYAEVSFNRKPQQRKVYKEEKVEYGELSFSATSQKNIQAPAEQMDCVYSTVRLS